MVLQQVFCLLENDRLTTPVLTEGLVSWYYYPPGTDPRTPNLILDTDYFDSEDAVITHVRDKGLERPAPVSAVLARSKGAAKTRSSETGAPEAEASEGGGASEAKSSAGRSSKRAGRSGTGAKQKSKSASSRSRKSRPSSEVDGHGSGKAEANGAGERAKAGGGSGEGDDDPWVSNGVVGPDGVVDGGDGDGHGSGDADGCIEEDTRDGQAEESRGDKAADAAVDEASGGTGAAGDSSGRDAGKEGAEDVEQDAALGFDFENGEEKPVSHGLVRDLAAGRPEAGDQTDSSTVDAQVSDGNRASDGRCRSKRGSVGGSERSKAAGVGPAAAAEACAGSKRDRSGRRSAQSAQESQGGSVRRSHGRTMQSEAIHASSRNNGGDSRVPVEATRQTVAMRELASSPPAPSPSKRPKRSGSHLPPQELSRLANKQIKHLRALVDGTERPFRGPIGLDGPISTLTKFIKDNHSTWLACQPGPKNSNTASMTGARRQGALILAGPGGTGKTTVFTSAMSSCAKMASSPRFVTIRCTTGGGADGDGGREVVEQARIYSKVLAAVTGKNRRLDGNKPLEELEKMAVPSYPVVLCMEEGDALDRTLLSSLMNMAYRDRPLFSMVVMARSVDVGYEVGFEQGMRNRDVVMVPMLPYPEDTIRSILGQAMGAADEEDLDGAMVATLVNKGALDVIAKTVARVCGSARIALNVCIVALVERTKELAKDPAGVAGSTLASGANHLGGGGVASSSSRGTAGGAPTSPGHAARHSALMNITGAKNALNKLLQLGFDATGESTAESTSEAKEEIAHAPMG